MEILDIVDEENNLTGKTKERKQVHEKALWHRQVACWIMNKKGELLFQKRAAIKKQNPNKWSRTGGHVDTGEEPIDGIQREILEEIGVLIPKENLKLLEINKVSKNYYKEGIPHNYYAYEYFTVVDYKIENYTIQKEELSEVKYMSIEEMEEIKKNNNKDYTFIKWENFNDIVEMLKKRRNELCEKK